VDDVDRTEVGSSRIVGQNWAVSMAHVISLPHKPSQKGCTAKGRRLYSWYINARIAALPFWPGGVCYLSVISAALPLPSVSCDMGRAGSTFNQTPLCLFLRLKRARRILRFVCAFWCVSLAILPYEKKAYLNVACCWCESA
jgi:hypothetical protein